PLCRQHRRHLPRPGLGIPETGRPVHAGRPPLLRRGDVGVRAGDVRPLPVTPPPPRMTTARTGQGTDQGHSRRGHAWVTARGRATPAESPATGRPPAPVPTGPLPSRPPASPGQAPARPGRRPDQRCRQRIASNLRAANRARRPPLVRVKYEEHQAHYPPASPAGVTA